MIHKRTKVKFLFTLSIGYKESVYPLSTTYKSKNKMPAFSFWCLKSFRLRYYGTANCGVALHKTLHIVTFKSQTIDFMLQKCGYFAGKRKFKQTTKNKQKRILLNKRT